MAEEPPLQPKNNKTSRLTIVAVALMVALTVVAGLSSMSYIQNSELALANHSTIIAEESTITSLSGAVSSLRDNVSSQSSEISSQASVVSSQSQIIVSESSEMSNQSKIINGGDNMTLLNVTEYTVTGGVKSQFVSLTIPYAGNVIFSVALVPSGGSTTESATICEYEASPFSSGVGNYFCPETSPETSSGVNVWVGWFAATPGVVQLSVTPPASGTLVFDAFLQY